MIPANKKGASSSCVRVRATPYETCCAPGNKQPKSETTPCPEQVRDCPLPFKDSPHLDAQQQHEMTEIHISEILARYPADADGTHKTDQLVFAEDLVFLTKFLKRSIQEILSSKAERARDLRPTIREPLKPVVSVIQPNLLVMQRNELTKERTKLIKERTKLIKEQNELTKEQNELAVQRKNLTMHQNQVSMQRDELAMQWKALSMNQNEHSMQCKELLIQWNMLIMQQSRLTLPPHILATFFQEKNELTMQWKQLALHWKELHTIGTEARQKLLNRNTELQMMIAAHLNSTVA
ncbi:hypothetical protein HDU81_002990 [Chytriomyces hyalinus]|nr:hypothetical protein HDU81_002990 [Chytriomyces hyalinus]